MAKDSFGMNPMDETQARAINSLVPVLYLIHRQFNPNDLDCTDEIMTIACSLVEHMQKVKEAQLTNDNSNNTLMLIQQSRDEGTMTAILAYVNAVTDAGNSMPFVVDCQTVISPSGKPSKKPSH